MALDTRHVHLASPLPADQLLLQRMHGIEELGRPFLYELELLSPDPGLKLDDLLGDKMSVVLALPDGDRSFNGHVARFGQAGMLGRYTRYHCTLRPFFWLLTRASDSRIFKKASIPDIVKQVVGHFGLGQIDDKLQGTYLTREYTVQYRETYFDFLSRLMEEEGIYYWFRHEKDQHVMVLCDDPASHKPVKGYEKIPFIDPEQNAHPREEHFGEWVLAHEVASGAYAVNDFDFEVPRADLLAKSSKALPHKHASFEQYDPLAGYVEALDAGNNGDVNRTDRGELFARVRLEELQAEYDRAVGRGNARGPYAGGQFKLTGHPRDDQNRDLLVVRAEYSMFQPGFDAGSSAGRDKDKRAEEAEEEPLFEVSLTVQPAKVPFRARRLTMRPTLAGPHAATVVGSGEIWTDKYGRVKVHFPWDREDKEGCWVRVAQLWAGSGWGGLQVPRVGQEVIVEFLEGDPDRPIITGRVYNGANAPPFALPGGATVSGILTRSTPGGSADNANELRFEDKKGAEQVLIHAERNMDTEVEKDQSTWVGHDRRKTVDNDQLEEIKGHKTIKVHKNHTESILQNMSLHVTQDEEEKIGGNRSVTVTGNHTEQIDGTQGVTVNKDAAWSVGGNGAITFQGTGALSVGKDHAEDVGANFKLSVADNATIGVGKNANVSVDKDAGLKVSQSLTINVTKDCTLTVEGANKNTITKAYGLKAKEITVEADKSITLKTGSASIKLESGGKIVIEGSDIAIKASGTLTEKGSKIVQN
jgi:type VI secretion system secreted protein VgrG